MWKMFDIHCLYEQPDSFCFMTDVTALSEDLQQASVIMFHSFHFGGKSEITNFPSDCTYQMIKSVNIHTG